MNREQKSIRTAWGMASKDWRSFEIAYKVVPKNYKRIRRMLKHQLDKLEEKIKKLETQMTMYGD